MSFAIRTPFRTTPLVHPAVVACLLGGLLGGCTPPPEEEEERQESAVLVTCGGADDRRPLSSLAFPYGAIGKINHAGGSCSASIIAPNKVLTAAHCVDDGKGGHYRTDQVAFFPQWGIQTANSGILPGFNPIRITQGRDSGNHEEHADWAILTFDPNTVDFRRVLGRNYHQLSRAASGAAARTIQLVGYHGDLYDTRPGVQTNCSVSMQGTDPRLWHDCDSDGGSSGGPLFAVSGTQAFVYGVQSSAPGSGTCQGTNGNLAANGESFAFAPDNAVGIATAMGNGGRLTVYAADADWRLISARWRRGSAGASPWNAWRASDTAFTEQGARLGAVNLSDGRQQMFLVRPDGTLRTRAQSSTTSDFGGWSTIPTGATIRDLATSGRNGIVTHLFTLGTDNVVRVAHKTGTGDLQWSAWQTMGTVAAATDIAAVAIGDGAGAVHQVFVAAGRNPPQTSWGSQSGFVALETFGSVNGSNMEALAAGKLQDGRVVVFASLGLTSRYRVRSGDGQSWGAWTDSGIRSRSRVTGFSTLAIGNTPGGHPQVFGVSADGNIFASQQDFLGNGQLFWGTWVRFYK